MLASAEALIQPDRPQLVADGRPRPTRSYHFWLPATPPFLVALIRACRAIEASGRSVAGLLIRARMIRLQLFTDWFRYKRECVCVPSEEPVSESHSLRLARLYL